MKWTLIPVLWICCAVFNRGYMLGSFTMEFPAQHNVVAVTAFSLLGPLVLPEGIIAAMSGAPYMTHGYSCQQRWEEFIRDGSNLGTHYFSHEYGNFDCKDFVPEK